MNNVVKVCWLLLGMVIIAGCQTNQSSELDVQKFISTFIEVRQNNFKTDVNSQFAMDGKVSYQNDSLVFISFTETINDSTRTYTLLHGGNSERPFDIRQEFAALNTVVLALEEQLTLAPGSIEEIGDLSGDGFSDFLLTDAFTENSNHHTRTIFIIRKSNTTLRPAAEPIMETICYASCNEEDGGQREYAGSCIGHVSEYKIENANDGTIPNLVIVSQDITADARCNNWIGNLSERVYQWVGDAEFDFVFLTDRAASDVEIIGNENPLDQLLMPFNEKAIQLITELDGKKVRFQPCDGGLQHIMFYKGETGWMFQELGYQDVINYGIKDVNVGTDNTYTILTDNQDMPEIKLNYDEKNELFSLGDRIYTTQPKNYDYVQESPCDI